MTKDLSSLLIGDVLEEDLEFTLTELCRACSVSAERIVELVDEGLVEPFGTTPARWRFRGVCLRRVRRALRLERDLGVNTAGAALALDLLDEIEIMRARLKRLDT